MASEALDIRIGVSLNIPDIGIQVDRRWKNVEFEVDRGGEVLTPYEGPYTVDASFYFDKVLGTYGKKMTDDVTVNRIPVVESSNPQGGKTILIGA